MLSAVRALVLNVFLVLLVSAAYGQHFPEEVDPGCRGGRAKIYDECGSQMALLDRAIASAKAQGKTVLVEAGAEWCVWCHSFAQTISGMTGRTVVYHEGEAYGMGELPASRPEFASDIRSFVETNFVVVSIETQFSPDGNDVLDATGAPGSASIPYVFTLKDGQFASALRWNEELPGIELRSDDTPFYRGFDRALLLSELKRIAEAAR